MLHSVISQTIRIPGLQFCVILTISVFRNKVPPPPQQAQAASRGSRRLRLVDFLDFRHYEGGKVVTLTHRLPSPPRSSWYSFLEAESTPGHMELSKIPEKIPSEISGIDPGTHRLVAQRLNHYATPGPFSK
jgi:hypothetical protein